MQSGNRLCGLLRSSRKTLRIVRKAGRARRRRGVPSAASGRRPEDLVLLDLPEAVSRCQATVDREPLTRVPKVRQVESPEAGRGHSRMTNDEIIFDLAGVSAVSNIEIEGVAAPLGEHLDRVVEGTWVACTQFEEPRKIRGESALGPPINLLSQHCRH